SVEPALLDRVGEVVRLVDVEKTFNDKAFKPLVLTDARDLIRLVDDEDIRLADYVTKLTDQGRWEDAKRLNSFVTARFTELSLQRRVPIIRGVNSKVLEENGNFIELKLKQVTNLRRHFNVGLSEPSPDAARISFPSLLVRRPAD